MAIEVFEKSLKIENEEYFCVIYKFIEGLFFPNFKASLAWP